MFKLRTGYLISGIITGCILLFTFVNTIPDGNLHIIFCDVGQGDAAYIKFPDGRDMLIDGGPNDRVIGCLSRHMPFWDRSIDMVAISHPQRDHIGGLPSVVSRYRVGYILKSKADESSDIADKLKAIIQDKKIPVKVLEKGETVAVDAVVIDILAPSGDEKNINDLSLVFTLHYGSFDTLFTGDAPLRQGFAGQAPGSIEVVKVPHHGSKTGLVASVVSVMHPIAAIISVGKNSFGHPSPEVLGAYSAAGSAIHRTDKEGDIEIISDGKNWGIDK